MQEIKCLYFWITHNRSNGTNYTLKVSFVLSKHLKMKNAESISITYMWLFHNLYIWVGLM